MREIRQSGSEGGGVVHRLSLPLYAFKLELGGLPIEPFGLRRCIYQNRDASLLPDGASRADVLHERGNEGIRVVAQELGGFRDALPGFEWDRWIVAQRTGNCGLGHPKSRCDGSLIWHGPESGKFAAKGQSWRIVMREDDGAYASR